VLSLWYILFQKLQINLLFSSFKIPHTLTHLSKKKKQEKNPTTFLMNYILYILSVRFIFCNFYFKEICRFFCLFFPKRIRFGFFFPVFCQWSFFFCNSVWKWTKYFCVCLFLYIAEMSLPPFDYFKIVCCSGSYPTWFPTLPCDAWNYCSHPFCSRSPDGRRKCKARGKKSFCRYFVFIFNWVWWVLLLFL
jgi:hypothetical protein